MDEPSTSIKVKESETEYFVDVSKRVCKGATDNDDSDECNSIKSEPDSDLYYSDSEDEITKKKSKRQTKSDPSTSESTSEPKDHFALWSLFFDETMITNILACTNKKITMIAARYSSKSKSDVSRLDIHELYAFIGLLIYTAVFKSNDENILSIFATDGTGREIFKCVMSRNRFILLLNTICFDESTTRIESLNEENIAPVSHIFNSFVANCQKHYTIGPIVSVDEQFISFENNRQSIKRREKNPFKYGLKILFLCDAETNYFYNGHLCTDKCSNVEIFPNSDVISTSNQEFDSSAVGPELPFHKLAGAANLEEPTRKSVIYTCRRRARTWHMGIFYHLLDISTVNAYILYQDSGKDVDDMEIFLKDLARSLVIKHLLKKVDNVRIPHNTKVTIRRIIGTAVPPIAPLGTQDVCRVPRKTCRMCPPVKKRKTNYCCLVCKVHICMQCSATICLPCAACVSF